MAVVTNSFQLFLELLCKSFPCMHNPLSLIHTFYFACFDFVLLSTLARCIMLSIPQAYQLSIMFISLIYQCEDSKVMLALLYCHMPCLLTGTIHFESCTKMIINGLTTHPVCACNSQLCSLTQNSVNNYSCNTDGLVDVLTVYHAQETSHLTSITHP